MTEPMKPLTKQPSKPSERWPKLIIFGAVLFVVGVLFLVTGETAVAWGLTILGGMMLHAGLVGAAVRDKP